MRSTLVTAVLLTNVIITILLTLIITMLLALAGLAQGNARAEPGPARASLAAPQQQQHQGDRLGIRGRVDDGSG